MKKLFLKWLPLFFCAIFLGQLLSSCGGGGDDPVEPRPQPEPQPTPQPTVTLTLSVNDLTFDGDASKATSQSVTINCNSSWSISGKPDWIDCSTSGNGTATIPFSVNSDNKNSEPRTVTVTINAGTVSASLKITQKGLYAADCEVKPGTIVALANSFAMDWNYGTNVHQYYAISLLKSEADRKNDAEIIDILLQGEYNTPSDGYVTSWKNRSDLTSYYVYTLGFDKDGKQGNLCKTEIKTKSSINQACAFIDNVWYDEQNFHWQTSPNAYTTRYYQCFMPAYNTSLGSSTSDATLAWFLQSYKKKYPNDKDFDPIAAAGDWHRARNGQKLFFVVTWALDVDGDYSGVIDKYYGTISSSNNVKMQSAKDTSSDKQITYKKDFGL